MKLVFLPPWAVFFEAISKTSWMWQRTRYKFSQLHATWCRVHLPISNKTTKIKIQLLRNASNESRNHEAETSGLSSDTDVKDFLEILDVDLCSVECFEHVVFLCDSAHCHYWISEKLGKSFKTEERHSLFEVSLISRQPTLRLLSLRWLPFVKVILAQHLISNRFWEKNSALALISSISTSLNSIFHNLNHWNSVIAAKPM